MARRGLGRGLSSLLQVSSPAGDTGDPGVELVAMGDLVPNPNQPRQHFEEDAFDELVASIKQFGVVQPILVRPRGAGYELVAGERRWRAAMKAGLNRIPAVVRQVDDAESLELALIENLQRENLNAVEEASGYEQLIEEFGLTQAELAERLGKSRVVITNTLRLLKLPDQVKRLILDGGLSSGHARAILGVKDEAGQVHLAERIVAEGLTVRQAESAARLAGLPRGSGSGGDGGRPQVLADLGRQLSEALSAPVRVRARGDRGSVEIKFESAEELRSLSRRLLRLGKTRK